MSFLPEDLPKDNDDNDADNDDIVVSHLEGLDHALGAPRVPLRIQQLDRKANARLRGLRRQIMVRCDFLGNKESLLLPPIAAAVDHPPPRPPDESVVGVGGEGGIRAADAAAAHHPDRVGHAHRAAHVQERGCGVLRQEDATLLDLLPRHNHGGGPSAHRAVPCQRPQEVLRYFVE
jgi:hypothetical protein